MLLLCKSKSSPSYFGFGSNADNAYSLGVELAHKAMNKLFDS